MTCNDDEPLAVSNTLGVVVIGRNEGARLINCLTILKLWCDVPIVYVDSGSVDGSVFAAERLGVWVVPLNLTEPFTAARARNEGFAALRNRMPALQFVQFIDGDCELDSGWLHTALEFLSQQPQIAIVCGRRRERWPGASVYNLLCDIEWNTAVGETLACGGDSLVRVAAFEEVGGFCAQLIAGEEPELCVRLRTVGWKIWRLDAEMTKHDAAMTHFRAWWRRNVRNGYGFAEVFWRHKHSPLAVWRRELFSTILWAGLLPLVLVLSAFICPTTVIAILIYPLQLIRMAWRRGAWNANSWTYAAFILLAHFPMLQGIITFAWRGWRCQPVELIEYKNPI